MPSTKPSDDLPFRPGDMLDDRWAIHEVLPGAMGIVLLLNDPGTGGRYAAKTPWLEREAAGALARFQHEARVWLSLGHNENVVEAFFLEEIALHGRGPRPFLFLEWVDGPTLEHVLEYEGRLAVPVALDVASGMAWGMAYAHGEGREGPRLVHRDLKPENVFVTRARGVKVSDFGIARALDAPEESASEGAGLGTPFYAAPEQMRDARSADRRSDVYSYGAVLYRILTGRPPFPADDLTTLVWKVLREAPEPPSTHVPAIPPELDRLVLACLEKDPANRPEDFTRLLVEVSEVREIDRLWQAPPRSRSCGACGWLSIRPAVRCVLCATPLGAGERYAPASPRSSVETPTLGRRPGTGVLRVEGMEIRPRRPRAREQVVITALVGNDGAEPVEDVVVPFLLPDRDAFVHPDGPAERAFRGSVPPTVEGAPLRISWSATPLVAGTYRLRPPRVIHRRPGSTRRTTARGEGRELVVLPNDTLPLVGRERELGMLHDRLDGACDGTAGLVALVGETGAGKSRLLREARKAALARGFTTARGRSLGRLGGSRGALRDALRQLIGLSGGATREPEAVAALIELLGPAAGSVPGLLRFLTSELLTRPVRGVGSPAAMWAELAPALARERPLLLVLEDVHRDPEVARIAHAMVAAARREGVRFLVLLSGRPVLDEDFASRLLSQVSTSEGNGATGVEVLRLEPLDAQELRGLVESAFTPNDFQTSAPWLIDEITRLAGGSPLAVAELVRTLQQDATEPLVAAESGRWTALPALTPESLGERAPQRFEELILARMHELPERVGEALTAAGALGDIFRTDLLRAVLGHPDWFDEARGRLEESDVLREIGAQPPRIRFREPLLPDVLDRKLRREDPDEHARIHGVAADWLRERPEGGARHPLKLGRHLVAAGRRQEAFPVMVEAAQRLADRQSFGRAARILDEARELLAAGARPRRGDRRRYLLLRGEALRFAGRYDESLAAYRELVEQDAGSRLDRATLADVYAEMGKVQTSLGRTADALYHHSVALALREELDDRHAVASSLMDLAEVRVLRGERAAAERGVRRALDAAREAGSRQAEGRAWVLQARHAATWGETRTARQLVRRALRCARAAGDRVTAGAAYAVLSLANLRAGRLRRALVHGRRALRVRQQSGDLAAEAASWNDLGLVHEAVADAERARRSFTRAVEIHRRIGAQRGLATGLNNLGRILLRVGRLNAAREHLEESVRVQESGGDPSEAALALADLARVRRLSGETEEAESLLFQARERLPAGAEHAVTARVALAVAHTAQARGDGDAAAQAALDALSLSGVGAELRISLLSVVAEATDDPDAAAEAERLAEASASPWTRARALAARGRVALAGGERTAAASLLRRAAGILLQAGARNPLLVGVLRDTARALREDDPDAAATSLTRARRLGAELRAAGYSAGPGTGFPLAASEASS